MKKTKFGLLLALLILCFATLISAAACGGGGNDDPTENPVEVTLKLDKTSIQLFENEEKTTVRATLTPADKTAQYEWDIEDSKIATISPAQSSCSVTPKAQGTTILTVTVGDKSAHCTVNVGADRHVQLKAPSFEYDGETGIISITDTQNDPAGVGAYELQFFKEGDILPSCTVEVKDGEAVDTRRVEKGDYTVKLVAKGSNPLFLTSELSASSANISIDKLVLYDLGLEASLYNETGDALIPDRWAYYKFDWVDVTENYCENEEVTFSFKNNTSDDLKNYSWITQLIYSHGKTDNSKLYKMQLSIDVSQACRISLGGKKVSLNQGENLVTVAFKPDKEPTKCLFKIEFGIANEPFTIVDGTVKIKRVGNILETTEQTLKAPSFTFDDETKIITIEDTENSPYDADYTIGFFENLNDTAPKGKEVVKNGGTVQGTSVLTGKYYIKIMAVSTGLPYKDSAWSAPDADAVINVVNRRVDIEFGVSNVEAVAKNNPGNWYYWYPETAMGGGGATTFKYLYIELNDDGSKTMHMSYQSSGNYQPMKIFYTDTSYSKGDLYELRCKLTSPMAGKITVNGIVVDVKEGVNDIAVARVHPGTNETVPNTITLQFGAGEWDVRMDGYIAGEITIDDLVIEKIDPIPLEQITSFTYSTETQSVTVEDPNDYVKYFNANVQYELGYFKGRSLAKTQIVTPGDGFEYPYMAPGDYTLKLRIVCYALYSSPDWFEPETPISVHVDNPDYTENLVQRTSGATSKDYPGTWTYWANNVNLSSIYIDAKSDIHVSYSIADATKEVNDPIKLFYRDEGVQHGDLYKVTFDINVPNDACITVNGKIVRVKQGDNTVSVTRTADLSSHGEKSCTFVIQFGATVKALDENGNLVEKKSFIGSGTVVVSNIKWELTEPEALQTFDYGFRVVEVYNEETGALKSQETWFTISDLFNGNDEVTRYVVGFFDADGNLVKSVNSNRSDNNRYGKEYKINLPSGLTKGATYTIKIKVESKDTNKWLDTDWFGPEEPYTFTKLV